ncbi:MAG: arsenate reductase ArsC [Alphaproteobacteria bacterium]
MPDLPGSVLFACTTNSVRSPMAEGYLKHLHGHHIYVDSVGLRSREIDGFVIAAMGEIGIDVSGHRAKTFEDLADKSFDVVVSLSPEAHHRAIELTRAMACEAVYWPTHDPTAVEGTREMRLQAYRDVRDALIARIQKIFPTPRKPA